MSTRLGVRRTAEVVSATQRTAPDGRLYYDIQTRVRTAGIDRRAAASNATRLAAAGTRELRRPCTARRLLSFSTHPAPRAACATGQVVREPQPAGGDAGGGGAGRGAGVGPALPGGPGRGGQAPVRVPPAGGAGARRADGCRADLCVGRRRAAGVLRLAGKRLYELRLQVGAGLLASRRWGVRVGWSNRQGPLGVDDWRAQGSRRSPSDLACHVTAAASLPRQTSNAAYEKDEARLRTIAESFVCREV